MRKKKKEKLKLQQFWSTFFYINAPKGIEEVPPYFERVNFRIWDHVSDEELLMMVSEVRSIGMLDLDETDITNEGIQHLAKLDFIRELRLKGIRALDNECIDHLNKINGLELLHLGGTSIDVEGVLKLKPSVSLKTLLISVDEEPQKEKMLQLRNAFPACEFILNHKVYTFDDEDKHAW